MKALNTPHRKRPTKRGECEQSWEGLATLASSLDEPAQPWGIQHQACAAPPDFGPRAGSFRAGAATLPSILASMPGNPQA